MSDELLNNEQTAKLLGWQPGRLSRYRQYGLGPKFIRTEKNYVRYRRRDVEEFIRTQRSKENE